MTGGTRKKGSSWYYYFDAGKVDGKRNKIERVGGKTRKEANAALRKALSEFENSGLHFEPTELSVSDYFDYWYKEYVLINCKYNTQRAYKNIIDKHIKPELGIYKLKGLQPAVLQQFINKKYNFGYSKNHLFNMYAVLSGSLKSAVFPFQFIKENPMQYIRMPKYEHSKIETDHKIIDKDDFTKIMDRFPCGSSFYIPLMIAYHTGTRVGECTGLTWDCVNIDDKKITINKILQKKEHAWYFASTKTQSSVREIRIGATLLNILKQHKKWQSENRLKYGTYYADYYLDDDDNRIYTLDKSVKTTKTKLNFICTKENGEIITSESIKYCSRVINYELMIQFNFHSLRHTHATMLIENGVDLKSVSRRLGHATLGTTADTYTHETEKMQDKTIDIFEKALNE